MCITFPWSHSKHHQRPIYQHSRISRSSHSSSSTLRPPKIRIREASPSSRARDSLSSLFNLLHSISTQNPFRPNPFHSPSTTTLHRSSPLQSQYAGSPTHLAPPNSLPRATSPHLVPHGRPRFWYPNRRRCTQHRVSDRKIVRYFRQLYVSLVHGA